MTNTEGFIHHHQLLYVHPLLVLLFIVKILILMILLGSIFIVNCNSKLLNGHDILLCYCLCCFPSAVCCAIFYYVIVCVAAVLLLFHLLIYFYISILSIYLFCGLDLYQVQPFQSSLHIGFTIFNFAYTFKFGQTKYKNL